MKCNICKHYYLYGNNGKIYPAETDELIDHKCTRKNDWFIEMMKLGITGDIINDLEHPCDTFKPCSIYDLMKIQAIKNDL